MALVWLLAGCAQTPTPVFISEAEATQTALPPVTVVPSGDKTRLQVWVVGPDDDFEEVVEALTFEPLLGYGTTGELHPLLAAELPEMSPDGLAWSVRLRAGALFQDGVPCDAGQVLAALQAILAQAGDDRPLAVYVFQALVDRIEPLDQGLVVYLKQPFESFPALLADHSLAIVSANGSGTGPFVQTSAGEMGASFDAFAGYYDDVPALLGVDFVRVDASAFQNAMLDRTGIPDLVLGSEAATLGDQYQPWPEQIDYRGLFLRRQTSPLNETGVMEALALAATDPVGAREGLAAVGLPDGFDMQVWATERTEEIGGDLPGGLGELPVSMAIEVVPELLLAQALHDPVGAGSDFAGADVTWTYPWEREWWEWAGGGLVMDEQPSARSVPVAVRLSLAGLELTSGGWPRITAGTALSATP